MYMLTKMFIIMGMLFAIASCTQDVAEIEIHHFKPGQQYRKSTPENNDPAAASEEGEYIIVELGETIYSIAIKHNKSYLDIASLNNLEWPYTLEVGQKLYLTKSGQESLSTPVVATESSPVESDRQVISETITPEEQAPSENKIDIQAGATGFKWPINGKVISNFGINANGTKNDGIYIETTLNEPVKATSSGKVIYAGQDLEQYGNLLIISHNDQWFSAYAHLSELNVTKGAEISAGQVIGLTGDTGNISSPQLYFSLRKNKTPVDPLKFLPRKFGE
jgi:murein DD-endopeptidase MepM/ murein hydrolase activator NlpD